MNEDSVIFCRWCNQATVLVWVHGHGQCSVCNTNIDECCRGERREENEENKKEQADDS